MVERTIGSTYASTVALCREKLMIHSGDRKYGAVHTPTACEKIDCTNSQWNGRTNRNAGIHTRVQNAITYYKETE